MAALGRSSDSVSIARARLGIPDKTASPSATPFSQSSNCIILTQETQETDEVRLSLEASRKSLVQGHVMKAPYLSDMGEESGELEGSRPPSVGSCPASTQPSVLELGEARSRRSVYQASQPYSLASASMSMSRLVYDRLQEIRSAVLLNKEEEDIDSNIEWDDIDDQSEISSQRPSWHKEIVLLLLGPGKKQHTALCTLYTALVSSLISPGNCRGYQVATTYRAQISRLNLLGNNL